MRYSIYKIPSERLTGAETKNLGREGGGGNGTSIFNSTINKKLDENELIKIARIQEPLLGKIKKFCI